MLHKNLLFRCLETGKLIFCSKKMKTPFGDIVCHCKIHTCAQYRAIITNYSLVKVMTKIIFLEQKIDFPFSKRRNNEFLRGIYHGFLPKRPHTIFNKY